MMKILVVISLLLYASSSNAQYNEKYRPQYHFSPEKGWIGDPDGLVYYQGTYHLFWWGHAVSKDLIHWKELPYPMKGGNKAFSYFSGSVVVDTKNTSGFGDSTMIAMYTMHRGDTIPESQGLSVSKDLINFNHYDKSPVLNAPAGKIFFRDPQVFWYAQGNKWVMVVSLANEHKLQIYESVNLKDWKYLSEFGPLGPHSAFWECPDLYELPVKGMPGVKKWVLVIGQGPNQIQYFTGTFDGVRFIEDQQTHDFLVNGTGLPGHVYQGFDSNDFGDWKVSGSAFGNKPMKTDSINHLGAGFVSSLDGNAADTGRLLSPVFKIKNKAINFLLGGGNHPDQTCVNLIIGHQVVRSVTGNNSKLMKWYGWDVSNLIGKDAQIEIIDNYTGKDWGFISVDHIMFSNVLLNHHYEHGIWMDYGSDFYAVRSWRNIDTANHKHIMIGWLGNWEYARDVPSTWGKGFESLPREIYLEKSDVGMRIIQHPLAGLKILRRDSVYLGHKLIKGVIEIKEPKLLGNTYEIEAEFDTKSSSVFGFNLLVGSGRKLVISYDPKTANLVIDRTQCTDFYKNADYQKKFSKLISAPVEAVNNVLKLHIYVDKSSVEIFANDGRIVLSALTFPSESQTGIEIFSTGNKTLMNNFKLWEIASIWR